MSFLADLSKRQPKPGGGGIDLGKMQSFGLARAFHLPTPSDPVLATGPTERRPSQTFQSPFQKSAIEILQELERKAEEDELARQAPSTSPETIEPVQKTRPPVNPNGSKLLNMMSRRQMNGTTLTPTTNNNQDDATKHDTDDTESSSSESSNQDDEPVPGKPSKSMGSNASMLEEMMQRRSAAAAAATTPSPPPSTSSDSPSSKPSSGGRNAMLEEMMKKRGTPPPAPASTLPSSTESGKSTGLSDMMKRRAGLANHAGAVPGGSKNAMLAEMMKKRGGGGGLPPPPPSMPSPPAADTPQTDVVPLKDDPKYSTYFLMLKRGLPKPAVQHRMQKDNVDPAILDMDPNQPFKLPTLGEDPQYEKYFKMLKTGLPRPVVEHKLTTDRISIHLLDLDVAQPTMPPDQLDAAFDAHKAKVVEKYKKMLKLGMPPGAVDHAMTKDGVDPAWLHPGAARPSLAALGGNNASFMVRKVTKPDRIRKKLHWVVLNKDAMKESTLWKQPSAATLSDASIAALEHMFTKSIKDDHAKTHKNEQATSMKSSRDLLQAKVVNLMDMKKAQNIGITLARIKVPFEKIKDEILNMNPTIMSPMHLKALIDLWPDVQEMKAIREFQGDLQTLGLAERFCYVMRDTPRFTEKLQCLIFKQEFNSRSHELRETVTLVLRCVNQICTSTELRDILLLVLKIGNVLNFGKEADNGTSVRGFSLSSLVKLSQTKAFVGQTTLLQFLVEVVDRDAPSLAKFDEEVGLLERASRVVTQQLYMEKKALEGGRTHLINESNRIKSEDGQTNLTAAAIDFFLLKVDDELADLTEQLDKLNHKKTSFLHYVGEEGNYELDELFSVLWAFTEEFRAAHRKFVLKKARGGPKKKPPAAECA
ncbi:Aste57867_19778 [Aphanomyces stellatus]|uniref:Aste57867_19778 protein n=1 Tax=Aphanomyces stellatus TaxID=120398 RepID=A0A485LDE2_9STRA|nr:hypothetical protein As57867_019713 [Aphanomyces stellatus]VFT96476.1 Aste57867_19778 [Aphanomyces stellatus]